jgi:hypothetical protein
VPVIAGVADVPTVTLVEASLTLLQEAVAFAVITDAEANADKPVLDQAPEVTVVVPNEEAPLKTSIVVPSASVLVPLTVVALTQIGDVTVGADVTGVVSPPKQIKSIKQLFPYLE